MSDAKPRTAVELYTQIWLDEFSKEASDQSTMVDAKDETRPQPKAEELYTEPPEVERETWTDPMVYTNVAIERTNDGRRESLDRAFTVKAQAEKADQETIRNLFEHGKSGKFTARSILLQPAIKLSSARVPPIETIIDKLRGLR